MISNTLFSTGVSWTLEGFGPRMITPFSGCMFSVAHYDTEHAQFFPVAKKPKGFRRVVLGKSKIGNTDC